MRLGRAGVSLFVIAPLGVLIAGCPSLDGFVGQEAGADAVDSADAAAPSGGYLSLTDAIAYCSKALTCGTNLAKSTVVSLDLPIDSNNFAACVSWMSSTLPSDRAGVAKAQKSLQCAAQATSCSAAAACMWFEAISATDPRCVGYTGGSFGQCSPNLAATYECPYYFIAHCDNPFNYSGSSCLKGNTGYYFCAVSSGQCSASDAGTSAACSGSYNTDCQDGFLVGFDCEVQGMTCGQDPLTKQYGCLSNGHYKSCAQAGTFSCSGDSVDVCDGITTSEINCGTLGATCDATNPVPRCALPNETCSPYDTSANVCTGDVISLCINGQPSSFDCSSAGMHCQPPSGKTTAHCG
jgi:hypothetical protein